MSSSADVTATFCATLVDEWIRSGVSVACIAPGPRSTPMALALTDRDELRVEVFHDERSAAFAALGVGMATGTAAILLCTSGTAAAHFYAAVIEAGLSGVPMLVVTADRPPELVDVAAPQTIDQTKMFGDAVRWFHAPGVPDDVSYAHWRSLGARAAAEAHGFSGRPGVAHLNLAFREPLVGTPGLLPAGRNHDAPWHSIVRARTSAHEPLTQALLTAWTNKRGVFLVGRGAGDPEVILSLAELLGWPVLSDHRSGCAVEHRSIRHFDSLLRVPAFAGANQPDIVVRIGELPASKVTNQWVTNSNAIVHAVVPNGKWIDPDHTAGAMIIDATVLPDIRDALVGHPAPAHRFSDAWEHADAAAAHALQTMLAAQQGLTDPAIARATLAAVHPGGALVVSSSMPVRDVEWFGQHRGDIRVYANRGANGIDGVIATSIGVAITGVPTVCLVGDVAFLHDSSSLSALKTRSIDLTIVVVDNNGGAIFSFLPQATSLDTSRYEKLFGTPHTCDLTALAISHGLDAATVTSIDELHVHDGCRVLVAHTRRESNVELHDALNAAVAAAVVTL